MTSWSGVRNPPVDAADNFFSQHPQRFRVGSRLTAGRGRGTVQLVSNVSEVLSPELRQKSALSLPQSEILLLVAEYCVLVGIGWYRHDGSGSNITRRL